MYVSTLAILFCTFATIYAKVHIDVTELRCLVCKATVKELDLAVKRIDPAKKVEVGGYRLDAHGNTKQKTVLQSKSEIYISELADKVCEKMDDYVRATWKDNGKLTLLQLIDSNGNMNLEMSKVDIIQDDDLNKSLKYYCEGIIEEYEESIIDHYKQDSTNIASEVCIEEAQLCKPKDMLEEVHEDAQRLNEEL